MALNYLLDYIKNQPLLKLSVDTITKHRDALIPAVVVSIFGGVAFYLVRRRKSRATSTRNLQNQPDVNASQGCLADLPPETRSKIWKMLKYEDLLTLRIVSEFTKNDVENWVGLRLSIKNVDDDQFEFAQRVGLQSCIITDLPVEIDSDFLLHPCLMLNLELMEMSPMPLSNLVNLLTPCINLVRLQLHFLHSLQVTEISEQVLQSIKKMQYLEDLKLFRLAIHSPVLKSFQQPFSTPFPVPTKLVHAEIEIPDVAENQVASWKYLLEQQTNLETLTINFGIVHWHFVLHIIPNNPELTRIGLVGICNQNPDNGDVIPFDWEIFANCSNLQALEVSCPPIIHSQHADEPMSSTNFHAFPCDLIEEFYVYKVALSPQDVQRIYQQMKKLKSGSLNRIGDAGTEAAAEMFWMHRQEEENAREEIIDRERLWDIVLHSTIGLSILSIVFTLSRRQQHQEDEMGI